MEFSSRVSSPGLGTTEAPLSREPLATEGEATPGPDDEVNLDDLLDADVGGEPPAMGPPPDPPTFEFELPEFEL